MKGAVYSMMNINCLGVLGGDKRQAALAELLAQDGYTVYAAGLDHLPLPETVNRAEIGELEEKCTVILLPLPVTKDGKTLFAPFSEKEIVLDDSFAALFRKKEIYGGQISKLLETSSGWEGVNLNDYSIREEFAVENAAVTAESAIALACEKSEKAISGSRCLVAGFGRIGKALAWMLRGIGAEVTVSARKASDLAWIRVYGYTPVKTQDLAGTGPYDFVFNTVPFKIFTAGVLERMEGISLLMDLASMPGGVDFAAAQEKGIPAVHALSLPGKMSPRTAAGILKNTVYAMMEE